MLAPKLKASLVAEREEQDGQVFYQLTDPASGHEFRLYEIEYLIAQMLDGVRDGDAVIQRVRNELKFDLRSDVFENFVSELHNLGFLERSELPPANRPSPAINREEPAAADPTAVEIDRLVRSAILHIKQGLVAQARDYFLAARKLQPADGKTVTMLNHLEVVGEDDNPSDIEYLWRQAATLYPDLAQEIGPPGMGVAPIPIEEQGRREGVLLAGGGKPWLLVSVALAVGLFLGVGWFVVWPRLSPAPVVVETDKVHVQKVNLYYVAELTERRPKDSWNLSFDRAGVLAEVNCKRGDTAKAGELLARLRLAPKDEKAFLAAHEKAQQAEKKYLANQLEGERLLREVTNRQEEARVAQEKLDEAQKEFIIGKANAPASRAAAKRQIFALKKTLALSVRDLNSAKAKSLVPKKFEEKLKAAMVALKAGEKTLLQKSSWAVITSPRDALVTEVNFTSGDHVAERAVVAKLVDPSTLEAHFRSNDSALLKLGRGTKLALSYGDDQAVEGVVSASGTSEIALQLPDPDGKLLASDAKTWRLVSETLERAMVVAKTARVGADSGFVVEQNEAFRHKVEWLDVRGRDAIAKSGIQPGDVMITGPESALKTIVDGSRVALSPRAGEDKP